MESFRILEFLKEKTILVTGATGFLAKIFVEKILRIQPNVKKLYLLVRAEDTESATQRMLHEVEKELFRVVRDICGDNLKSFLSEKLVIIPGDVSHENLRVTDFNLREEMWREIEIVVNFAALTRFDERYDVALDTNTMGAFHVLSFAEKCLNIKMLLHVSTAYVCGERSGIIPENPFYDGETLTKTCKLDITGENKLVKEKLHELEAEDASEAEITSAMKDFGLKRARVYGWPNTYVFTKAMGEMMLGQYYKENCNIPIVILRPTMITSTYKEPFPGWIEGLRTIDAPIVGYGKGKLKCLLANPHTILDLIPADMVVNSMIMAMIATQQSSQIIIYHIGSSMRNPFKILNLVQFTVRYFTISPYIDKKGKPVKVGKVYIMDSPTRFRRFMAITYGLPLKGLKLVNSVFCCKYFTTNLLINMNRKFKFVMQLVELYKPYMFFEGVFDDTNSEKLRNLMSENEIESQFNRDSFNFNPECIDWEDYFIKTHIPGLLRYVAK